MSYHSSKVLNCKTMDSVTTPSGNTFCVGDLVRIKSGTLPRKITKIRKSYNPGASHVAHFDDQPGIKQSFIWEVIGKGDNLTKIDASISVPLSKHKTNQPSVIKRNGICIKCIANPARDCDCGAAKMPRKIEKKEIGELLPISRIGWDNISYNKKLSYLHYPSNTVIFGGDGGRFTWLSRHDPITGRKKTMFSTGPKHDAEELMIRVEGFLKGNS